MSVNGEDVNSRGGRETITVAAAPSRCIFLIRFEKEMCIHMHISTVEKWSGTK